jgi:hypothetical protein
VSAVLSAYLAPCLCPPVARSRLAGLLPIHARGTRCTGIGTTELYSLPTVWKIPMGG